MTKSVLDKRQKNAALALYELTIQNRIVIETMITIQCDIASTAL